MRLVFLGPPGAGKGTQAERQANNRDLVHISTGQILREAMAAGTELGKKVSSFVESGALVPDGLVVEIVAERLGARDCADGWILDGFPRTIEQARALEETLAGILTEGSEHEELREAAEDLGLDHGLDG